MRDGSGSWEVENGRWKMRGEGWGVEDGVWRMGGGGWGVDGRWIKKRW